MGVDLVDLVGLAVRRNPRRAHLLVSTVLGKHLPTDPHLVYGAGLLLGGMVAQTLASPTASRHPRDLIGGRLLRQALDGVSAASAKLVAHGRHGHRAGAPHGTSVLGYAETATALGHAVADALDAPYLHSTRRLVHGVDAVGRFEEEHSHATSHLLLPEDAALLSGAGPLVLVDDELSTGTTALNTLTALHAVHPRGHYVIASLVDLRSPSDRARLASLADELCARIDVVALASGQVDLPDDVLGLGRQLVRDIEGVPQDPEAYPSEGSLHRVDIGWPHFLREGGRHGWAPCDRRWLEASLPELGARLGEHLSGDRQIHVLGFEELMYVPLRLAQELADSLPEADISFSATTRSPVLPIDDPGYAIRSRLTFAAHDNPADGPGDRYAYNLASTTGCRFDTIVLIIDAAANTRALEGPNGLVTRLAAAAAKVVLVVVPDYRPSRTRPPGETS